MLTDKAMGVTEKALDKAKQLAEIASDWNLDEVEIDGEMVDTYSLVEVFDAALAELAALRVPAPQPPQPDWSEAPEWAQWWAADPNGLTMWYEEEPLLYETVTFCGWGANVIYGSEQGMKMGDTATEIPLGVDWRLLKQRRPTPAP